MKQKYYYNHGLPFGTKLAENLLQLQNRVKLNKASMIIIDGEVGEGKTTLACHCADFLEGAYIKGEKKYNLDKEKLIQFKNQLSMGGKEFIKKLKICFMKKLCVLVYDEAGDFNKRGSLTRLNLLLNRVFDTFRTFKVIVIIVLPNFADLDNSLFEKGIPRMLLHCFGRSEYWGNFAGYSLKKMFYLKDSMKKMVVRRHAFKYNSPNFYGHFFDLTPNRSKLLDKVSTDGKNEILEMASIVHDNLLDYSQIAIKINHSIIYVRKQINKLKIKEKKIYKNKKYFDKSVVDILFNEMDNRGIK